jgi:hypothetical protein
LVFGTWYSVFGTGYPVRASAPRLGSFALRASARKSSTEYQLPPPAAVAHFPRMSAFLDHCGQFLPGPAAAMEIWKFSIYLKTKELTTEMPRLGIWHSECIQE